MAKEGKEAPFPCIRISGRAPFELESVENMWISGYFAHGYADDMICVESIDTIHKMIHTGPAYGIWIYDRCALASMVCLEPAGGTGWAGRIRD